MPIITVCYLTCFPLTVRSQTISTIAGTGTIGYSGDGASAIGCQFNHPVDLAIGRSGRIYTVDAGNYRVRVISSTGLISTVAGNGVSGFSGDGGPATAAEITPSGIAVDDSENIYIAESSNHRIRKVNSAGVITTVAGNGTLGLTGDGGAATAAAIGAPTDVTVDHSGNLYFIQYAENKIRKISSSGIIITIAGTGATGYSGDGGPATAATFHYPSSILTDRFDNLYIGDQLNNVIRKITVGSNNISTIAGDGTSGYFGDHGPATMAKLNNPWSMAVDDSGNVFIADSYNHVIRKVFADLPNTIVTLAGNGFVGNTGDGGPATDAELNFPAGIAVDQSGNIYVSDQQNNNIRELVLVPNKIENLPYEEDIIRIWPNPAADGIVIESKETIDDVAILSIPGQTILQDHIKERRAVIDISQLTSGLYFLRINDTYTKYFVKRGGK